MNTCGDKCIIVKIHLTLSMIATVDERVNFIHGGNAPSF